MSALIHIRARRATDAPAAEIIEPKGLSGSIQWMPPGHSTISASVNGAAKKVNVTSNEQTAQLVDRRIKEMIAAAHGGNAGLPYIDFDHSDGEAAGWPQGAWWAGSDPITGGVRINLEWSEVGQAKVRGKSYQGFSPEFMLDSDGMVQNVGLNLGGLVNRPAFTGIQRVSARAEDDFVGENLSEKPDATIMAKAAQIKGERGIDNSIEAMIVAARENPGIYDDYRKAIGLPVQASAKTPLSSRLDATDFTIQAKKMAYNRGLREVDAMLVLAREQPELYHQYHASLGSTKPVQVQANTLGWNSSKPVKHRPDRSGFVVMANEVALKRNLDEASAMHVLAQERPELYHQYNESLGSDVPVQVQANAPGYSYCKTAKRTPDASGFVVLAKQVATDRELDVVSAAHILARERPDLYEQYRTELGRIA